MAVEFNGFRQTDTAVPGGSCASGIERFCGSGAIQTLGHRWLGGPKQAIGTTNKTFTMPKGGSPFNSPSLRILFFGSAQMFLDSDYTPATGTGEWEVKLNVISVTDTLIELREIFICLTNGLCANLGTVFSQSFGVGEQVMVPGIKTYSGIGTMSVDWASDNILAYLYQFINLDTVNPQSVTYKPDQAMMYPRVGHNQIGLGTGIMSRGDLSDVPPTLKRHTMVGQPG